MPGSGVSDPDRVVETDDHRSGGVGLYELPGFASVPRIQIVTIEQAMALRDRAVHLPARRDDGFKKAAKEVDGSAQGALEF